MLLFSWVSVINTSVLVMLCREIVSASSTVDLCVVEVGREITSLMMQWVLRLICDDIYEYYRLIITGRHV